MKDLGKILFGFLCALLAVGIIQFISDRQQGYPIQLTPPPTPASFIVHVSGAVLEPGLYYLDPGSRVWDAVQMAGGFSSQADQEAWNLAELVLDGSQIHIPTRSAQTSPTSSHLPQTDLPGSYTPTATEFVQTSPTRIKFPIDINTASAEELELLPQIGQVRAARIFSYRQSHGYFKKIEDIRNVYDITPEVYAAIRDLITASQPPTNPMLTKTAPAP